MSTGEQKWETVETVVWQRGSRGRSDSRRLQQFSGRVPSPAAGPILVSGQDHVPGQEVHCRHPGGQVCWGGHPGPGEDVEREQQPHSYGVSAVHGVRPHQQHWGSRQETQTRSVDFEKKFYFSCKKCTYVLKKLLAKVSTKCQGHLIGEENFISLRNAHLYQRNCIQNHQINVDKATIFKNFFSNLIWKIYSIKMEQQLISGCFAFSLQNAETFLWVKDKRCTPVVWWPRAWLMAAGCCCRTAICPWTMWKKF